MSATKENLTERLEQLKAQKEQALAQVNAIAGAIQVTEAILKDHYTEEPKIVLPTAQNVAAVAKSQRQGEEQKPTLRFPVPSV